MKTILLIEDDKDMRENTAEILELANYKVYKAENGRKGVEIARKHMPDLVLCDIMMPELDGYGVLHMLGKDPATAELPFIFLSAKAERSDVRKGMELGADDYITKPIEQRILTSRVTQQLKRGESQRAPRQTILTWENLSLDLAEHLFKIGDKEILLTNSEYRFLQLLMENPERVFSKEQVLQAVSSLRESAAGSVETYAGQLRAKIKRNGGPDVIDVVRSVGFRLASNDVSERVS